MGSNFKVQGGLFSFPIPVSITQKVGSRKKLQFFSPCSAQFIIYSLTFCFDPTTHWEMYSKKACEDVIY